MRILIPVLGFGRAGGFRVLSKLADGLNHLGCEVIFIAPSDSAQPYFPTGARIVYCDWIGRARTDPCRKAKRGGVASLRRLWEVFAGISRMARRTDIVIANHNLTAPVVALMPIACQRFYYVQAYEPEYYSIQRRPGWGVLYILSVLSYFLPLKKIVNAPVYRKYGVIRASAVVPPGLDFTVFSPRSYPQSQTVVTIGTIGRDEPEKGTKYAIEAFCRLERIVPNVRFRVAYGGGIGQSPSPKNMQIVVPRNDVELGEYYRSLDIIVAPALGQHGAPHYPVLEAMASKVAVITTGYLLADEQSAWIVPPRDSDAIFNSVLAVLADEAIRSEKIQCAFDRIQALGWPSVSKRLCTILTHSLNSDSSAI